MKIQNSNVSNLKLPGESPCHCFYHRHWNPHGRRDSVVDACLPQDRDDLQSGRAHETHQNVRTCHTDHHRHTKPYKVQVFITMWPQVKHQNGKTVSSLLLLSPREKEHCPADPIVSWKWTSLKLKLLWYADPDQHWAVLAY